MIQVLTPGCVQLFSAHKSNIDHKSASCTMYQTIKYSRGDPLCDANSRTLLIYQ